MPQTSAKQTLFLTPHFVKHFYFRFHDFNPPYLDQMKCLNWGFPLMWCILFTTWMISSWSCRHFTSSVKLVLGQTKSIAFILKCQCSYIYFPRVLLFEIDLHIHCITRCQKWQDCECLPSSPCTQLHWVFYLLQYNTILI